VSSEVRFFPFFFFFFSALLSDSLRHFVVSHLPFRCVCVFPFFSVFSSLFFLPFCSGFCLLWLLLVVVMVGERDVVRPVKRLLLAI
jgi:hypothetical protein